MNRLTSTVLTISGLIAIGISLFACAGSFEIEIDSEIRPDDETVIAPSASFIVVEPALIAPPATRDSIRIAYANVRVTLDGDLAKTVVTEVMVNDLETEKEATFRFPLPQDATVTDFAHFKDGARVGAAIGGKVEARAEYDRAVAAGEKASLGEEKAGRQFEMTLAPIAPGGLRRVELSYTQTLSALGGERTYALPAGRFSEHVPTLLDIDVVIRGQRQVASARSFNHPDARVVRHGDKTLSVHLARSRAPLGRDFVLAWNQPTSEIELDGRAAVPEGSDRVSEVRFAFNRDPYEAERPVTSVVLVIDHSLSMAGAPLARAQELAASIIDDLGENDRLALVGFASAVSSREMAPASSAHKAAVRSELASLVARGHSSLTAALDEAARMVAGEPGALIVIASDGQPTPGDLGDDTPAAKPIDVAGARVMVAHFNYPSRSTAISALFPTANVRFVPDGDAGDEVVDSFAKLAVAPTIDDLEISVDGTIDGSLVGSVPDRLAMGESVRLLARSTGDVVVRVSGTLHGKPISRDIVVAVTGDAELADSLTTEWARKRIAELEVRYDKGEHQLAETIRALGIQHRLATRFTSFVATDRVADRGSLDDADDYDDADSLSPDRIKPGDPEIRIRAAATARRVFGVLPWGEIIECSWQDDEGLWLGRFLVPRETPDGLYRIRVFVADQASAALRGTLLYRVDSAPPTFELDARYEDGTLKLEATPVAEVFDSRGDSIKLDRVDLKRITVRLGRRDISLARDGEGWTASLPLALPRGKHTLTLTAVDYASNSSQAEATIEVP